MLQKLIIGTKVVPDAVEKVATLDMAAVERQTALHALLAGAKGTQTPLYAGPPQG